jgi:diguanylate cyclase (GGDEF)-like protein
MRSQLRPVAGLLMTNLERDIFSLVTLVSNVMEAYSACLFLENKPRKIFQLTAVHSLSPHIISNASIKTGQGFMGWVLENNAPLSIDQFNKDTVVLGYYSRDEDIKSFMAAPLPTTMTRGALAVDGKKQWSFNNKSQKILAGFAQQFAYLVDGALNTAQVERQSINISSFGSYLSSLKSCDSEDQLLNTICLVPRELVPFTACFLVLKDEEAGVSRLVRNSGFGELFMDNVLINDCSSESVSGYVLGKGESLRLPDIKKRPLFHEDEPDFGARSLAAVPLKIDGKTVGVLGFTNHQRNQFDPFMLKRAEVIAAPAADALSRLRHEIKLQQRVEFDALTGGRNIAYLRSRLDKILQDAKQKERQVALLEIRHDDAHAIQNEFSVLGSEGLIKHLFSLLEPFSRDGDILVRYEGSNFFLLLQGTSIEHAEAVADRILLTINENPLPMMNREISLTACVGAACFPEDARDSDGLFVASSRALQFAQSLGINQVSLKGGVSNNAFVQ